MMFKHSFYILICVWIARNRSKIVEINSLRSSNCDTQSCKASYTPVYLLYNIRNFVVLALSSIESHIWSCNIRHTIVCDFPKRWCQAYWHTRVWVLTSTQGCIQDDTPMWVERKEHGGVSSIHICVSTKR